MNAQPSLFDRPAPAARGSASSRAAAARMTVEKRLPQWLRILEVLRAERAAISRESLSKATGIKESSLCARLDDLRDDECIEVSPSSCVSDAGVTVDGYRITARGRACSLEGAR